MTDWLEVTPAYGRVLTTQKDVRESWDKNQDFRNTATGSYLNRTDIIRARDAGRQVSITVRYGKNQEKVMSL